MIEPIINSYVTTLSAMPYFTEVHGLTELKEDNRGQIRPVVYGDGKWNQIRFNQLGVAYIRKRQATEIVRQSSQRACTPIFRFTSRLRVFAITKRETFPSDNAYSAERFASTIIRALTFDNGPLVAQVGATRILSEASLYSTDSQQVKQDELSGLARLDFNFDDLVVAIDVNLEVDSFRDCLIDPCDYDPRFCLQLESYVALP